MKIKTPGKISLHLLPRIIAIALLLCAFSASICRADTITIDDGFAKASLSSKLLFRKVQANESKSGTIAALIDGSETQTWHATATEADLLPKLTSCRYWFRFTLHGNNQQARELILEVASAYMNLLDVTLIRDGKRADRFITGHRFPFVQRPVQHAHFLFPFTIQPDETITVVMLIEGRPNILMNRLRLWDAKTFREVVPLHLMMQWFFVGVIAVVALYNLMIALFTREPSYLYYVCFVVSSGMLYFTVNGYSY